MFPSQPLHQVELLQMMSNPAKVHHPISDAEIRDQQAQSNAAKMNCTQKGDQKTSAGLGLDQAASSLVGDKGGMQDQQESDSKDEQESNTEDELSNTGDLGKGGWSSMLTGELESGAALTCLEPYMETDGDICWRGSGDDNAEAQQALPEKLGTAVLTTI
ncbi:hypothetical protein FRC10_005847 [Ceratobasidium sp. 414]|nr:hypothetical protein FRC10_005847 [Ceratobasidium sp. 414]